MTPIDAFLPLVVPSAYGCPVITAELAILQTCIDFCKRTQISQRILAAVDIVATTEDYGITAPADMQFNAVLGVSWQGVWLTPIMPDDVQSDVALRGANIGSAVAVIASPQFYFQKTTDLPTVSVYPIPDTTLAGGLFIKAAFGPTQVATTVDDPLYNDWAAEIAHGALARLKGIASQPWTGDPAHHTTMFERGVAAAKRQKFFGKLPNGARVQPQPFR